MVSVLRSNVLSRVLLTRIPQGIHKPTAAVSPNCCYIQKRGAGLSWSELKRLFHLPTVLKYNIEVLPILVLTGGTLSWLTFSIVRALTTKESVRFTKEKTLAESMDLCDPPCLKLNACVPTQPTPWPELAAVLNEMEDVEERNYRIFLGQEE